MPKEAKVLLGIAVIVLIGGVFLFFKGNPQPDAPSKPVDAKSLVREDSYMSGSKDAKVTLVEFGDYQCPFCGSINPVVAQVIKDYQGNKDFNFVFRDFPLPQHNNALVAAEAAHAAGAQGKFWEMHDKIYATQAAWENSSTALDIYAGYAADLGLDVQKFRSEVTNKKYADIIQADESDGIQLGVNATPTFYLNGTKLEQITTIDEFKAKIDEALKQ